MSRSSLDNKPVTIIGGGVAGLSAGLAMARRGAEVSLFERAEALREVGAGLQISPNAGRVLEHLGLGPALDAVSLRMAGVVLHDHRARPVAHLPLARHRPGDAFRVIHRARLIEVLARAAEEAGVSITLNTELTDPPPGLVIGAEGLRSPTRIALNGAAQPFFTGQTAWRAVIADERPDDLVLVFMGAGRHLVSYPLAHGLRNIVAVVERAEWQAEGWSHEDDPQNLRDAFAGFGGPVPDWLARVDQVSIWGLFRHEVARRWQDGQRAILGDAAHPTLPFMAQGAVMAIEDAWTLAACLDALPDQAAALARYETLRRDRCTRIVAAANANARNYHLSGPRRIIGHAGLRTISRFAPTALMSRFDWIYDYDPIKSAP